MFSTFCQILSIGYNIFGTAMRKGEILRETYILIYDYLELLNI